VIDDLTRARARPRGLLPLVRGYCDFYEVYALRRRTARSLARADRDPERDGVQLHRRATGRARRLRDDLLELGDTIAHASAS
jgi:hypothetical protein